MTTCSHYVLKCSFWVKQESITHSKCSYIRKLFTKTSNTIPSLPIKDKCSVPKFYLKFIGIHNYSCFSILYDISTLPELLGKNDRDWNSMFWVDARKYLHLRWVSRCEPMPVLLNLCSEINLQPLGNRIGDVMVSVFTLNAVDHVFEVRSGLTKDYNSGICCSFAKHTALWNMESG